MQFYQALLDKHPDSASANTLVGWAWWQQGLIGMAPPREVFPKAAAYAGKALELDPEFAGAYAVLTWVALPAQDFAAAEKYIDQHIKLSKGSPGPEMTGALVSINRPAEAEAVARKIMRGQPRYHDFVPRVLAVSLMQQGEYEEAEELLLGILASDTRDARLKIAAATDLVVLTKLQSQLDDIEPAIKRLLNLSPDLTVSKVGASIIDKSGEWKLMYLDVLREAGLPER